MTDLTPAELSAGVAYREMEPQPPERTEFMRESHSRAFEHSWRAYKWRWPASEDSELTSDEYFTAPCVAGDRIPYVASSSLESRECTTNWEAFVTVTEVKPVKRERWEWEIRFEGGRA